MPRSTQNHKSMLLRGVKFSTPALNQGDIEATKGRAANSGRSHGGAPLRGDGRGRGRGSFNYGSSSTSSFPRHQNQNQQSYNGGNGYNGNQYPVNQGNWQPPPPGLAGFARGPPPPPPPGTYGTRTSHMYPPLPGSFNSQYQQPPPAAYGYDQRSNGNNSRGSDYAPPNNYHRN